MSVGQRKPGLALIFGPNTPLLARLISSMLLIILKPLRLITGPVYQNTSPRFNITLITTDDEPVSPPASSRMHFCPEDEKWGRGLGISAMNLDHTVQYP